MIGRHPFWSRMQRSAWLVLAATVAACGGDSPAAPAPATSIVTLGPQVLRIILRSPCGASRDVFPVLVAGVTVARSGNGWVATAGSDAAGDVQVRFQPSGQSHVPGTMRVAGTVVGTAIHMPEMLTFPTSAWRTDFGTDGRVVLEGFAFTANALIAGTAGVDGVGTGSVRVIAETTGESCTASSFSWSIFPPQ